MPIKFDVYKDIKKLLAIDKTIGELKKDKKKNMCLTLALNLAYFSGETEKVLKFNKDELHEYLSSKLPSFNFTNARDYFEASHGWTDGYWWNRYDIETRIDFLNFVRDRENYKNSKKQTE